MSSDYSVENFAVAVVDDDKIYRSFVSAILQKHSKLTPVEAVSGDELCDILKTRRVDCILLDYDLGDESGFSVKQRLEDTFEQVPPVVMLTGDERQSTVIKALRLGVLDYLPKQGLKPELVTSAIMQAVKRSRAEDKAKADHRRLVSTSSLDFTTGVLSRQVLDERMARLDQLVAHKNFEYAIVLIKLHCSSDIARDFGLSAAERALRTVADEVRRAFHADDCIGRWSEDTLIAILDTHSRMERLDQLCRSLRERLTLEMFVGATRAKFSCVVAAAGYTAQPTSETIVAAHELLAQAESGVTDCAYQSQPAARAPAVEQVEENGRTNNNERRSDARQRVLKQGRIQLLDGRGTISCIARNISPAGAGLRLEAAVAAPQRFMLDISGSPRCRLVEVRWQTGRDLGVRFLD